MNQKQNFLQFVLNDAVTKRYTLVALLGTILQFIIFKLLYPYADFFGDSYSYILAASLNLDINIWPIGYSKFLWLFHKITHSDTALVAFQFFLVQLSILYFFLTLLYFFHFSKASKYILAAYLFINPLSLYICNTINSDALFGALSILWFTKLIWISQRPKFYQLIIHALLLFLCFAIRNNAYYYPLVAITVIAVSQLKVSYKITGILLPALLIIPFIISTRNSAYEITGTRQFSLFTGWQLANNALYIYDKVSIDSSKLPTPQAVELNQISQDYFKHIEREDYRQNLESYVGNFFIRQPEAPLKQYFFLHYAPKGDVSLIRDWGKVSADFEPFGKVIIAENPIAYARYFVLPNIKHYFLPPLSHLEIYNYGINNVDEIAQQWFHYRSSKITCISNSLQGTILLMYPVIFLLSNMYLIWTLLLIIRKKGTKIEISNSRATLLLICSFAALNFIFSISTTINILRYQFIPMTVCLSFGLLLMDAIERAKYYSSKKTTTRITLATGVK
jgi:hypothetical protein